jgi:hypothetical protein
MIAGARAGSAAAPAHTVSTDLLIPVQSMPDSAAAKDLIERARTAKVTAEEEPDILPCPETDPCSCQCLLDRAADLADCWLSFRAGTMTCGLIIVATIISGPASASRAGASRAWS